ncbi:MAG: Mu-like prophage major head subunit gpT family protein [Proteobacteria bacterium]|nr:Mu-like prophage major head subunit gpT family protein [Pseudomonadota bacterium]
MAITQSTLSELLYPGLKEPYGLVISQWEEEYSKIFDVETSKRAYESYQELISFGQVPESGHAVATTYDEAAQGFKKDIIAKKYTLGFKVTREMHDDDQYSQIMKLPKALGQSVVETVETLGANVLNNAFSGSFTGKDAVSLCSTSHDYGNGTTFQNRPTTDADLSMTSYEQMKIDLDAITDGRGKKMRVIPKMLIVSTAFAATAKQILQSDKDPESSSNAINPFNNDIGMMVSHYVTDSDAWFVRTDQPGLVCQKRIWPAEFKKDNDFDTDLALFKTYFRLAFDWHNARAIYGSSGGGS